MSLSVLTDRLERLKLSTLQQVPVFLAKCEMIARAQGHENPDNITGYVATVWEHIEYDVQESIRQLYIAGLRKECSKVTKLMKEKT